MNPTKEPKTEAVTTEKLQSFEDVFAACEWVKAQHLSYPKRPDKPYLPIKHTAAEVQIYLPLLIEYVAAKSLHETAIDHWNKKTNAINAILEEFIKEEAGLNNIPITYRERTWSKAWADGHSNGYYEVYSKLRSLVEIFES